MIVICDSLILKNFKNDELLYHGPPGKIFLLCTLPLKYFKNEELKKTVENISKQEGFQVETANEIALIS